MQLKGTNIALTVPRLMVRETRRVGLAMTTGDVMKELADIQETVLLYPSTRGRPRAHAGCASLASAVGPKVPFLRRGLCVHWGPELPDVVPTEVVIAAER